MGLFRLSRDEFSWNRQELYMDDWQTYYDRMQHRGIVKNDCVVVTRKRKQLKSTPKNT